MPRRGVGFKEYFDVLDFFLGRGWGRRLLVRLRPRMRSLFFGSDGRFEGSTVDRPGQFWSSDFSDLDHAEW